MGAITEDDITKMLAATTHIGSENSETTMEQYIFKKRKDGINIINLKKTWEKLLLAARAIAAVENPQDVYVVASRPYAQRAVLKFARYVGCSSIAGRFTPGAFTNQIQVAFREPRLLLISDPRADHQPVTEGSYANIPVMAFCNVDSPTKFIDIAIPCNNKSPQSIGLMWWFLATEILRKLKRKRGRELKLLPSLNLLAKVISLLPPRKIGVLKRLLLIDLLMAKLLLLPLFQLLPLLLLRLVLHSRLLKIGLHKLKLVIGLLNLLQRVFQEPILGVDLASGKQLLLYGSDIRKSDSMSV